MAVDQVLRLKDPHKPEKDPESPVAPVLQVVNSPGGGVGQEDIQAAAPENTVEHQGREEPEDLQGHLKFGVLVIPQVVPHGAPEPGDDKPLLPQYPGTGVDGPGPKDLVLVVRIVEGHDIPPRSIVVVLVDVVVSEHKEEGFVEA